MKLRYKTGEVAVTDWTDEDEQLFAALLIQFNVVPSAHRQRAMKAALRDVLEPYKSPQLSDAFVPRLPIPPDQPTTQPNP